jgi:hypothetical protein
MGYMPIYHREVAAPIAKKDDVSYSYLMDGQLAYAKKKVHLSTKAGRAKLPLLHG